MLKNPADRAARGRNAIVYNAGPVILSGPITMPSFVRLLKQRHETVLRHLPSEEQVLRQDLRRNLQSLIFAEAVLEKGELNRDHPRHPPQVAFLGPTQAGKSSALNWLLRQQLAEASPLAGFTVHPQGFAVAVEPGDLDWSAAYFRQYHRRRRADLSPEHYDSFVLESAPVADSEGPLRGAVFWDTPDFDSVDAEDYRPAVLRVAALADVIVLVLSKDKYADLSVWELLKLLAPLGQPTLVCLNKIDPASCSVLTASFQDKWRAARTDTPLGLIAIPYLEASQGLEGLPGERAELLDRLAQARRKVHRDRHEHHARRLIDTHWERWVEPVRAEHRLQSEWRELVQNAVREGLDGYRRDYLNHPHHYETFQRALAELLTLLEIPGLSGALFKARQVVTWPVRQLFKLGQAVGGRHRHAAESAETAILQQTALHCCIRIGEALLLRRAESPVEQGWWREMGGLFHAQKAPLLQRFEAEAETYRRAFQPEIERTAQSLYDHLHEHPAVLNSLRATRATTEAAALAMAVHTGGIGVQDFIIAPAMLSLTSMLTEGALGRFMDKTAAQLRQKQMAAVEKLFGDSLVATLFRLPGRMDTNRRFDIPPELLEAAERHRLA